MNVIVIMACAIVGTIALLLLAGTAKWSFVYLIRYRWLKREVKNPHYELSGKRDILAVLIAIVTLIAVVIMVIYGVPFVVEHFHELPIL